jgi:hypothetical protein
MLIESFVKGILTGKITADQAFAILGERAQKDVQNKIVFLSDPPNSPATIEAKKSSSPLQDTGALKQHIRWAPLEG